MGSVQNPSFRIVEFAGQQLHPDPQVGDIWDADEKHRSGFLQPHHSRQLSGRVWHMFQNVGKNDDVETGDEIVWRFFKGSNKHILVKTTRHAGPIALRLHAGQIIPFSGQHFP